MAIEIKVGDSRAGFMDAYNNERRSHKAFPAKTFIVNKKSGEYFLEIKSWQKSTGTNDDDRFYVTILELPF